MKKIFVLALLVPVVMYAENISSSKITDVTVYQNGARVTNEATLNLMPGNNEIIISDITTSIDGNSVQVKLFGNAILLSATTRIRTLEDKDLPKKTKMLTDSLLLIGRKIKWLNSEKAVYQGEGKLIATNQKLGSNEEKATVQEIIQLSEFYRRRLLDIKNKEYSIDNKIYELGKKKDRINSKLNELRHSEKRDVGEVVLNVSAKTSLKVKAKLTYVTYQAGWTPIYDVRAGGADKPVDLVYKANVRQTTGYAWKNTNLVISTGNPMANNDRPLMYPWYIDFSQPIVYRNYNESMSKKAMPMQNMLQRSMADAEMKDELTLEEAPQIGYNVVESTNSISAEYAIDVAQDIPSDGKQHLVAMKEYELNTKFSYHAIPKLDKAAFLIAKVADYGSYNLLAGQANLFYDGMYLGQSYLNPATTVDSMLLSLGRDEKIIVKRNRLKDLTARQVIGTNTKETKAIEISVRNNNTFSIEMDLMDQLPIPQNKEIEVKIVDLGGAKLDADYGSLLWKLKIKAGETKKVKFVYTVKYPKDKSVAGL